MYNGRRRHLCAPPALRAGFGHLPPPRLEEQPHRTTSLPKPRPHAHIGRTVSVPPWREHNPSPAMRVPVADHSQSQCLPFCRWCVFAQPKPVNEDSDLMHHQHRLSVLQWNQAQLARTPRRSLRRPMVVFTWSSFKKPVIMLREPRTSSSSTQAAQILPSCSTRKHSSPMLLSSSSPRLLQARTRGNGSTCCSWSSASPIPLWHSHGHILLSTCSQCCCPKKRDASTSPIPHLHAHMVQHNVDFIGRRRGTST